MEIMYFLAGLPSVNREHLGIEAPGKKGEVVPPPTTL